MKFKYCVNNHIFSYYNIINGAYITKKRIKRNPDKPILSATKLGLYIFLFIILYFVVGISLLAFIDNNFILNVFCEILELLLLFLILYYFLLFIFYFCSGKKGGVETIVIDKEGITDIPDSGVIIKIP